MLDNQSKLALMLTSAGSQRKLAALMGVSHQKIGRWLREGEPALIDPTTGYVIHQAGAKQIPDYATAQIDYAFQFHKQLVIDQARADKIPYSTEIPVFMYRGIRRDGKLSDRVFAEHTQFIKAPVRRDFYVTMHRSKRFVEAHVRSTVDFVMYTKNFVSQEIQSGNVYGSPRKMLNLSLESFAQQNNKSLAEVHSLLPIYTKHGHFSPFIDAKTASREIEDLLRQKHESSAVHLADEYIFQLMPQNYVLPKRKQKKANTAPRRTNKNSKAK